MSARSLFKRALRIALLLASLGILAVALLVGLLTNTEVGTLWSIEKTLQLVQSEQLSITIADIKGTWLQGLELHKLAITTSAQSTANTIELLSIRWQPWRLLQEQLLIEQVDVVGVNWQTATTNENSTALTKETIQSQLAALPFNALIEEVHLAGIVINNSPALALSLHNLALRESALSLAAFDFKVLDFNLDGDLSLDHELSLTANLNWRYQWQQRLEGKLQLSGDVERLHLEQQAHAFGDITSSGMLTTGIFSGAPPELTLTNQLSQISITAGANEVQIPRGEITASGTLEALAIQAQLQLAVADFAPFTVSSALVINPTQIAISKLSLASDEIALQTDGAVMLQPLSADINWALAKLELSKYFPQLAGTAIQGQGHAHWQASADGDTLAIELTSLAGIFNNYPLAVSGDLALLNYQPTQIKLQGRSGDNTLAVSGSTGQTMDLTWQLNAPALAQLWQGLQGSMSGQGTLRGSRESPALAGELQGNALAFKNAAERWDLATLHVKAEFKNQENLVNLSAEKLQQTRNNTKTTLVDTVTLHLNGTATDHAIDLTAVEHANKLTVNTRGSYTNEQYNGHVDTLLLNSDYGNWQLASPSSFAYGKTHIALTQSCLGYSAVTLCVTLDGKNVNDLNTELNLHNVPLGWLNKSGTTGSEGKPLALQRLQTALALDLPEGLRVKGIANLEVKTQDVQNNLPKALQAQLHTEGLSLHYTATNADPAQTAAPLINDFDINNLLLDVNRQNGQWDLRAGATINAQSAGQQQLLGNISSTISLADSGALTGELTTNFGSLHWLEALLPSTHDIQGQLAGHALLSGTQAQPRITADMKLNDGAVNLPNYGLALHDINASILTLGQDSYQLNVQALSGAGNASLTANLQQLISGTPQLQASLKGSEFALANTASLKAVASPDMQLTLHDRELAVTGSVALQDSSVDLAAWLGELGNGAVNVSRDTVIVRGSPTNTAASSVDQSLDMRLNLDLQLGKNIRMTGKGLDVLLSGKLNLAQEPNRALLVYGELNIPEGSYELYRQRLSTKDGRLLFFGNPTNPGVDIRASRKVGTAEVGMQLGGSINNMQGQLYSNPTLPESETLALLVTGKSFNSVNGNAEGDALLGAITSFGIEHGQGLTSLVRDTFGLDSLSVNQSTTLQESSLGLGKYLSPKLLMRYEVGLFDRQMVLSLNYSLTNQIKLEVKTGISQSVDLSYTVEKN